MGPIELGAKNLREVIQLIPSFPGYWTISLPQRGTGRYTSKGLILYLMHSTTHSGSMSLAHFLPSFVPILSM